VKGQPLKKLPAVWEMKKEKKPGEAGLGGGEPRNGLRYVLRPGSVSAGRRTPAREVLARWKNLKKPTGPGGVLQRDLRDPFEGGSTKSALQRG